ncbi:DUF4139 domain-containing protein [Arcobacter sp. LA11]|uniref:DUF4139 domain-containing protein n=1 Tax=Arcobacter sp. LA11 TaxID=1898176 RepID=UPI000933C0C9|nr:DUF4139 domain-containing protein [Arcobacter sp. LA11]
MINIGKKIALLAIVSVYGFANTNINSIDIFTNRTFVNQEISLNKTSADLLGQVRLEDVRFKLEDGCQVLNSNIDYVAFSNDSLSKDIETLKDTISNKTNTIKSLKSNIAYLERTSITNISNAKNLEVTSKFLKKEILDSHNKIYNIEKELKKDNESLNKLVKKRVNTKFTKLDYDITCKKGNEVTISYPIYNISRNGFYDINYDSSKKSIGIKNSSFITQSTGVDFKNIDINFYTYNFVHQLKPNIFRPQYLDIYKPRKVAYAQEAEVMMDSMISKNMVRAKTSAPRPTFAYIESTTKSFFKASNINLPSGKKTEVVFSKDNYKANDSLEIDGYSQSQAFFKVEFKSKKLYGILNSKLYLDGTYIGRSNINEIKKDKKSSIFFGTNRFIDIKKELVKDMKEEPFFSMNTLKTQKVWKYKVTNNHKKVQKLTLIERLPISKHEDIKVKLIGKTKETKLDKNGKIYFDFELKPNESKEIEFGYEIEKPADK